ncbi:MAG: AI-2E family transporter, partial [Defluviitaleaceae bacterium]|nr:AI-2E family transporter [Defluviitaleaceae bacterium]
MNKLFQSRMIRSMIPYFILAIGVIVAFHVVSEISVFWGVLSRVWAIIIPFFYGLILAYILNMPCGAIQRLLKRTQNKVVIKRSRPISVLILMLIVLSLIALLLNIVIPLIIRSITQFLAGLDSYQQQLQDLVVWFNNLDLPEFIPSIYIDDIFAIIRGYTDGSTPGDIVASVFAGFGGAFAGVFRTFLTIVSSIYLLIEMERLHAFTLRLLGAVFSDKNKATILKYCGKLNFNFRQYIYVQTIDGLILGSLMTGLLLLFRSPHAITLGIMLGIVNYIPYFGSIFGTLIAAIVMAFTQGLGTAAFASIFMFGLQQLDGNVIQPKLMGGSFSLSPLLVIISVTIGGAYAGMLGMLVAIPIVALLKDILDSFIEYREEQKLAMVNMEEDETAE